MKYTVRLRRTVEMEIEADSAMQANDIASNSLPDYHVIEILYSNDNEVAICEACQGDVLLDSDNCVADEDDGFWFHNICPTK